MRDVYLPAVDPDEPTHKWHKARRLVWERDGAKCRVCGRYLTQEQYECGHIIDRVCGGSDQLHNLVVMCRICNQLKPLTPTREEYTAWALAGGGVGELLRGLPPEVLDL